MAVDTAARLRRSPRLGFAVRAPRLSGPARLIGGALLIVPAWLGATVAHELLIVALALLLPALAGLPFVDLLIAGLPVNYVYASAMVRYAGQIEPSGLALTGPIGASLAER